VPFGISSFLLAGGLARHHSLLEPCSVDRFARIPGNSEAAHGPGGAAAPGHSQERGIARAAARERSAAQAAHEAGALRACGPAVVRSAVLADPPAPVGAGVSGDARDAAGMAPQADRLEVGLQQAHTQARETFDGGCGKGSGAAARQGESALGCRRIQGELVRLGHPVGSTTVWEILTVAGIDPAPRRSSPTWRDFLTAQAQGIIACDFVHIDLVDLRRVYALVFLEHGTRRLHIAGVTAHPTGPWAMQQARNLAVELGVRVESLRFLLRDRDAKYTECFDAVFKADDIQVMRTAPRAPRMNAHCERVIGTLRREVLDHLLIWNETHARQVLDTYAQHYNGHRPHQARGQLPPLLQEHPTSMVAPSTHRVLRTRILSGVINEYRYAA